MLVSSESNPHAAKLTNVKFTELHKQLRPAKDEPWLTIPWRFSRLTPYGDVFRQSWAIVFHDGVRDNARAIWLDEDSQSMTVSAITRKAI